MEEVVDRDRVIEDLQRELAELRDAIQAIRSGTVDALVVDGGSGQERIYTLEGTDLAYRELVEQMHEGAATLSPTGMVLYANRSLAAMAREPLQRVMGRPFRDLFEGPDREACDDLIAGCLRSRQGARIEATLTAADGTRLPVEVGVQSFDVYGTPTLSLVVMDLSAHRAREAELRRARDELQRKVVEALRLTLELGQAEQRERKRLAQVLHDHLQQILVAAKMQLGASCGRSPDEATRRSSGQVAVLLDQAIESSRSLTMELNPPILDHAGLVPALEWLAGQFRKQHGLEVQVDADDTFYGLRMDVRVLLFQAVRELLFNVVKHSGVRRARVHVRHGSEGRLFLEVSDDGRGGAQDLVDRQTAEGHFGLRNVRERIELICGTFRFDSTPGAGTRVELGVPMTEEVEVESVPSPEARTAPEPRRPAGHRHHGKVRLVIVDDQEVLRKGLATLLCGEPDIDVVGEAHDGEAAIEMVRRLRPDVVLMDFSMPGMGGVAATRHIAEEQPDTTVIGLSMHAEDHLAREMLQAGAAAYVTKGGAVEDLLSAIRGRGRTATG